jgi:multisubunit Na+/H+ antiporter MnhB subunit
MKKLIKKRIRNTFILLGLYAFLLWVLFFDRSGTPGVGLAKGIAIGITIVILIIFFGTIFYTLRARGGWHGVRANLKHNFLATVSFDFEEPAKAQRKKK